jgi:hypothetical protein
MKSSATSAAKITALRAELDAIHRANSLYWRDPAAQSRKARAKYHGRLDRLEEIRKELAQLSRSR